MSNIIEALFLGLIEGLTEFLPVSSTGHLLLVQHFLGFQSPGNAFAVLIQLGAILAILYERTGSLIPGIVVHALINSLATLGALLSA